MNTIEIDWVCGFEAPLDWVHTHGMVNHDLPELEIKNVPSFLVESAASILKSMCDYMINSGDVVNLNEVIELTEDTKFRFEKSEPDEENSDHYEVERWQVVGVSCPCDCCGRTKEELN